MPPFALAPLIKSALITAGTSALGNHFSRTAINKATQKRLATEARLREARTARANQELSAMFRKVAGQAGTDQEAEYFQTEDAKNKDTFDATEQNSEVKIGQGLNLGGNELAQFTKLKADRDVETAKRNDARKLFHSKFLSMNPVQAQRGQSANELALSRSRFADELAGQKQGDDMEVSAIQPDGTMMALGDLIRVAGQAYGMYNMMGGMATPTPTPDLAGLDGIVTTGYTAPSSIGAKTSLGQAFGGGASQGFAPSNAMNMWASPPTPAWPASGGGWFGG